MYSPPKLGSQNVYLKVEFTERLIEVDPTDREDMVVEHVLTQPFLYATQDLNWLAYQVRISMPENSGLKYQVLVKSVELIVREKN